MRWREKTLILGERTVSVCAGLAVQGQLVLGLAGSRSRVYLGLAGSRSRVYLGLAGSRSCVYLGV